jgi:hypothetical protein
MASRAAAKSIAAAISLSSVSTISLAQNCKQYPPGPERFACASQEHPGMIVKQQRCQETGRQMGLREGHDGGMKEFVLACMQRKGGR